MPGIPFRQQIGSPVATTTAAGLMSAAQVLTLGNIYRSSGSPEGVVTASYGICVDETNKRLYEKYSGTGNTGWREVSPSVSGTWTPTATGVTNIDAVTGSAGIYLRVGDTVYFSAVFSVDTTSAAAFTFRAIVPITSNFAAVTDCIGTGTTNGNLTARVTADTTNDAIQVDGISTGTTAINYAVSGSYRVI